MIIDMPTVIAIVKRECARYSHHSMDDLASNLVASIWLKESEFENERHLKYWVRKAVYRHLTNSIRSARSRILFSELADPDGKTTWLDSLVSPCPPTQHTTIDAERVRKACQGWPLIHRQLILIIADGGSIIEAAREMGLTGWDALRLLKEARQFLLTGNSLTPIPLAA